MPPEAALIADSAPLSVEQATGLLGAREPEDDTPDATLEAVETESETEPTVEDLVAAEEPSEEVDEAETEDAPEAPIPAPKSWAAEDRAIFATIPREAQQVIAARESERDLSTQKAVQESSAARKSAEETVQSVTQLRAATEQVLQRAAQTFKGKWDNVDWATWAQSDPGAYVAGKAQFDSEQADLTRLEGVNQAQVQVEQRAFQADKAEKIKTEAPALLDPVKGPERVKKLETFLETNGIPRDIFHTLDAFTIGLAFDGMTLREMRASAKNKPLAQTRPAIRPGAAPTVRTPQRAAEATRNRFAQTGSLEDAVAVLNARK